MRPSALSISGFVLALGIVIGSAGTVAIANFWPRQTLAPALLGANDLRFGVDDHGETALCDKEGHALSLVGENGPQSLGLTSDMEYSAAGEQVLVARHCRPE